MDKGEEVLITLTPLGAPSEFPRKLTLNDTVKQVEVGRASKNVEKCLIAAKDNAWFDSPIMSRQHAKFSATANQKAYLLDNNSTHGTYIGNKRLDAHKEYPINNNELVTFGARVTSGARTYLAKEFRVGLEWRPFSIPASNSTKSSDAGLSSNRFHVPDDDEIESSSESSRDPSVEILDSHVRAYSVPSSEESDSTSDDDEDLSPVKEVRLSGSTKFSGIAVAQPPNVAGTTPHHAVEIRSEPPSTVELEITQPCEAESFGASSIKSNRRTWDLCSFGRVGAHEKVVLSSDSEDEMPEVLSSKKTQVRSATYFPTSSSTQAAESQRIPNGSPIVGREAEPVMVDRGTLKYHENPEKSIVEQQTTDPELPMDDSPLKKSSRKTLHESESTNGEEMDCSGLYYPYPVQGPSTMTDYNLTSNGCSISSPSTGILYFAPVKSMLENTQASSINENDYPHLAANCINTTRNNENDSAHKASITRRPPSPSDAALVKKAKLVDQRSFWPVMEQSQSHPLIGDPSEYQTQFNEVHEMGDADPTHSDFINERRSYCGFDSSPWAFTHGQPVDRSQIYGSTAESAMLSLPGAASSKSVAQGRPLGPAIFSACSQDPYVENCTSLAPDINPGSSIFGVPYQQPRENGSHSSRLNISDIVHPPLESTRNLKRKADAMTVENAEVEPHEESRVLPYESSQDVLTDAQPRDITATDETVLLEDSSNIPAEIAVNVQEPLVLASPEPPRKKVKTSVSTAIGIGKFVSGVCVGAVGIFAAFIATIPLSVQEEAMQELVSST